MLLDNEAVQALGDPAHPKHRRVLSHVQVIVDRKRRAIPVTLAVPTSVRVEAGWDRAAGAWSLVNRLRIIDVPLDTGHANVAATIRSSAGVSIADAHLGAAIRSARSEGVTVLTSDPRDVRAVGGHRDVTIVAI